MALHGHTPRQRKVISSVKKSLKKIRKKKSAKKK